MDIVHRTICAPLDGDRSGMDREKNLQAPCLAFGTAIPGLAVRSAGAHDWRL